MEAQIKKIISESIEVKKSIVAQLCPDIQMAVDMLITCYNNKGKVLVVLLPLLSPLAWRISTW